AVPRVEYQRVQRALRARPVGRGELGERQLEEGVELHAFATALRVFEQHAPGADVAGAHTRTVGGGSGRSQAVEVQDAEIAVAQVPAAVGDPQLVVEQAIEADEGVGARRGVHHGDLKRVIEARVHELHRDPRGNGRCLADPFGHLPQPAYDLGGVLGQRVAREGGRKVLL